MVSGQIKEFLDFVKQCQEDYSTAMEGLKLEEKRQCDLEHMIEFEESYKERCKIGTRLHKCRKARRAYKDTVEVTEKVVKFFQEPQHKKTLDQMTQLLGEVRKKEKYHENRTYIPRVKE